jgi:hypothetical protein
MKAELRIGNWVYPFDDINLVDSKNILRDCIQVQPKDFENTTHLEPIPLTEEWLERFGFENRNRDYFKGSFCVQYADRIFDHNNIFFFGYNGNSIEIKYVHQLQNLYFALTGEELNQNK